ncbi:HPF/RaiA family ribosome-associated protein [Bradyrhizobium sp. HKCCYLS2038]|uniref:HPF/RaiA family ribosome-associated protein n=1 Tax=unclassified Bradyrhizobium TaxID=2631580 RepID=UPI003EBA1A9E
MQTLPQIEFDGVPASPELKATIGEHVKELENRFGRATSCHIVVRGPGERHHSGGQYQVSIHLSLPNGREVNVGRTPKADERYSDLTFAVDNAFKRARRQLQDEARLVQGSVKSHEVQPLGTVVSIDPSGEFGFIEAADGRQIYFNSRSVLASPAKITPGTRVSYVEEAGEKGSQASTVKILGKHGLRL